MLDKFFWGGKGISAKLLEGPEGAVVLAMDCLLCRPRSFLLLEHSL